MTCMKKLTALLVSAALALSLLAGCGGSKALSQVIADLLSGQYNNVTVEVDPDLTAALKKAAAAGSTQEEVLAALVENLNLSSGSITFNNLGDGQQGQHGVTLTFQAGSDPDAAARSAFTEWNRVFSSLPDDGSYRAHVSMIETENGYYIAVDVEVLKAGSPDKDDPVTLTKIVLSGIYKTEYIVDETFDKTGLTVTAYYSNNTSKVVDNYSISPSGALTVQDDTVTITYEEYGQTASATISIAVTDPGFKMNGDTYEVYNADGLKAWAEATKVDSSTNCTLTANIDLENQPWTPVGDDSNAYTGTFDGGKHTISGLCVSSDDYVGLFGRIGTGGTVQNLTLVSPTVVSSGGNAGAVAGENFGAVENCHVTGSGTITGGGNAGGVVGRNDYGIVRGCSSTSTVKGTVFVGGVVGFNIDSIVSNCSATGDVTSTGYCAGGVVGSSNSESRVINCSATGAVNGSFNVGGVVGENDWISSIAGCSSTGAVNGSNYVGGVAGKNGGPLTACYSTGAVNGATAGGVAGASSGDIITACYWSGTVNGSYASDQGIGENVVSDDTTIRITKDNAETTWPALKSAMNSNGYTITGTWDNPTGLIPHP